LIGRLAVDYRFQGKGLGSILIADACRKVINASATLAVAGLVVEAKDAAVSNFYQHFGFTRLAGVSSRLILSMSSIPR